eukprot:g10397.t1
MPTIPECEPPATSDRPERGGTLKVVCPSYGRTGTMSMLAALEILGFGPCYHLFSVIQMSPEDSQSMLPFLWCFCSSRLSAVKPDLWLDGFQGRGLRVNQILGGYTSVLDCPAANFYQEILAANPDAKVVVTEREVDSWWSSIQSTISRKNPAFGLGTFFIEVLCPDACLINHMLLHIKPLTVDENEAKADYIRHNREVVANVPAGKLLQFSVKQGWEPLCDFLEVPVPDVPFPNVNSGEVMKTFISRSNSSGWLLLVATLVIVGATVASAFHCGGQVGGCALAAAEAGVLTFRVKKALAMRRVKHS